MPIRLTVVLLISALVVAGAVVAPTTDGTGRSTTAATAATAAADVFGGCDPLVEVDRSRVAVAAGTGESIDRSVPARRYPPGVAPDGITNATRLTRAHLRAASRSGFVAEFNGSFSADPDSDPPQRFDGKRYVVAENRTHFQQVYHGADGNETTWIWANTTMRFYRGHSNLVPGRPTRYSVTPVESLQLTTHDRLTWDLDWVATDLRNGDFNVTRVFGSDGRTLFVLRAGRISYSLGSEEDWSEWTYDATLVVDASGRIHYFHAYREATAEGDHRTFRRGYRLCALGVDSVARPQWLDHVPPEASLNVSVLPEDVDQRYLVVSNDRPDPLPANTVLFVAVGETVHRVAFETPLPPGETRYAYFTGEEFRLTDSRSVAERESECFGPWYEVEAYSETGAFFGGRAGTTDECEYPQNAAVGAE